MPNIALYSAGVKGLNKDLPPEEIDPREWSDGRNVRFVDSKAIKGFGDTDAFGTPLAIPYWVMPVQAGSIAVWAYGSVGNSGNDAFTKVLLHMDGVDAATTFTDTNIGGSAHVWTARGNAQIDTADKVFGSASGLFDGTGDWIDTPDSADFILGTNAFSVNLRFKVGGGDGNLIMLCGQNDAGVTVGNTSFWISREAAGFISAHWSSGAAIRNINTPSNYTTVTNPGWHDLEFSRTGNVFTLYIDGVQQATTTLADTLPNSTAILAVGAAGAIATNTWFGWIDEFMLSIGIARHTASPFTPAIEQFGTSSEANLYATDGATHSNVTRQVSGITTPYTVDDRNLWHGGTLSQIPIITNGIDKPQMWLNPSLATDFADLTNWPAGDRCELIKPFKQFMVAMAVLRGGTTYRHLVKWSHPAVPGAVPSSWDETDPTKLTGEVEILDELPGGIRDGLGLRNTFVIYKDNSTWAMQFVGGNSVFNFYPIFLQSGILSRHCVSAINNGATHFVATGDDFIIHDGQNAKSVLSRRMKRFIFNTLPPALIDSCFTLVKPGTSEIWFCFPEAATGRFCTLAAVYNWVDETTTLKQLPNSISYADIGPIAETSDPWDADATTWDSDATAWDLALFSAHFSRVVSANPTAMKLQKLDDETVPSPTGYLERTGLALIGQDRITGEFKADNEAMKLAHRIWPKATGAPFYVQLGAQEMINSPVVYEPQQLFTPGVDKYLDFIPVNGRFIAVKYTWQGGTTTEIAGYDLGVDVLGQQ